MLSLLFGAREHVEVAPRHGFEAVLNHITNQPQPEPETSCFQTIFHALRAVPKAALNLLSGDALWLVVR